MSLYPVSTYNIGTGLNNGGLFDSLGTAVLTDQNGNIVATLSNGQITFVGASIFNSSVYINSSLSVGNGTGLSGQYLVSQGPSVAPQWITLTVGNGTLSISTGTYLTGSVNFTANQSGNSSITIGTNATNLGSPSTIVARDSLGNFQAGTIDGSITTIDTNNANTGVNYFVLSRAGTAGAGELLFVNSAITYNTNGTITATNFAGSLTGSATLIDTTLTTTNAVFYIPFVPLSSSQPNGQVLGTDGGLTYNPSNNSFEVVNGTITSQSFVGSLTGSCTLVDNTLQTTGTQFLTMLPLSATTSTGQVVGTHGGISYTVGQNQLNIGNQVGASSRIPLCMLNNTLANGQFNSIQIGYSDTTNNSWYLGARYNTTATDSIFAIVPYGTAGAGGFQIKTDGTVIAPIFQGSLTGSATLIDTTNNTGATTQFLTFVPLSSTQTAGQVLGTSSSLGYVPSTGTLTATVFSGSLTGSATLIDTTAVGTNANYFIPFVPLATTQSAGQVLGTDAEITYNPSTDTLSVPNASISTNLITPYATVNLGLTVGDLLQINSAISQNFQITNNAGNLIFNNQWSPLAFPLEIDGNGGGVNAYNLLALQYFNSTSIELDTPTISVSGDTGVLFEDPTTNDYTSFASLAGTTWSFNVNGYNPNNKELTFSFGVSTTQEFVITTGGAGAQTITATISARTATRNGSAFTAFSSTTATASGTVFSWTSGASNGVYFIRQPITQYTVKFIPQNSGTVDTYAFTFPITLTYTNAVGKTWQNQTITYNPTNFIYDDYRISGFGTPSIIVGASPTGTSMISAKTLTKDLTQGTTSTTLVCNYLQAEYIGLVGEYTLSGTTGTLLRCFRGNYDNYEIILTMSAIPTLGTRFTVQPATATGTASAVNYLGSLVSTGVANSFLSYGTGTGAILFSMVNYNSVVYTAKIYGVNLARVSTFQASNIGSDATNVNVPFHSNGNHHTPTAYPSLVWTTTNSITANLTIRGFN